MSVTTADHNLVNNVLQPLTNGDDVVDVDVKHELRDASTSSKENSEVKVLSSVKDIPADDVVAKATDAAAEALLLHLETNGDLETISTIEPSEESHEGEQLISTVNGASDEHATVATPDTKADSTQDTLTEPSVEALQVAKESLEDHFVKDAEQTSTQIETAAIPSSKDISTDVTESDESGFTEASVPSLEDAADANKDVGDTPSISSAINVIDTHLAETQTTLKAEDSHDVSASASLSDDTPAAEIPTPTTEAPAEHSSVGLEEIVTVPESEPTTAASHEEIAPASDAVSTSTAESHDIPSRVVAEEESPAEEIVVPDAGQDEAPTPNATEAIPPQPTVTAEADLASVEDKSIPDAPESVAAPLEKEEVVEPEIAKALEEVEASTHIAVKEPAAVITAGSTEKVPAVEPEAEDVTALADALLVGGVDNVRVPVEEKAAVEEVAAVEQEVAVVEDAPEVTGAPEAPSAEVEPTTTVENTPVVDKVANVEYAPVVEETVAVEAAPIVEEGPVVVPSSDTKEEIQAIEVQPAPTSAEVAEEVPAIKEETPTVQVVEEEVSAKKEETEAPVVEAEVPVTDADIAVAEELPAAQEVLAKNEQTPNVTEVRAVEAKVPIVDAETAVAEEAPVVEEEIPANTEAATVVQVEVPAPAQIAVAEEVPIVEEDVPTKIEETPAVRAVEDEVPAKREETLSASEAAAVEVEVPVTSADIAVVDEVPAVEEEISVTEEEAPLEQLTEAEIPGTKVEALVDEAKAIEAEDGVTNKDAAVALEAPIVQEEVPVVIEEAHTTEEVPATSTEAPNVEEALTVEAEAPSPNVEVPVAEDAPSAKEEIQVVPEEVSVVAETPVPKVEASVSEPHQPPVGTTESTLPHETQSDEAATEVPVAETLAAEHSEVIVGEKPIEASPPLNVEEKAVEEDLPAEIEEVLTQVEEVPITVKEEVTHPATVAEDITGAIERQSNEAISEANVDVIAGTTEEPVEEKDIKSGEDVTSAIDDEPKPLGSVPDGQATLPSEFETPVAEHEGTPQEETIISTHEPVVLADEQVSDIAPSPVDNSASDEPQDDVKPIESHELAVEESVVTYDPIKSHEENIASDTLANGDDAAGSQVQPTKDADPTPPTAEEVVSTPSRVAQESVLEVTPVEEEKSMVEPEVREVNPTVDELPTIVAQPHVISADEELPAHEPAVKEMETTAEDIRTIPLPIDEIAEEVPEVVLHVSEEPSLEVHATTTPPVLNEDLGVPEELVQEVQEKEVGDGSTNQEPTLDVADTTKNESEDHTTQASLGEATVVDAQTFATTSGAPSEEVPTVHELVEPTEKDLSAPPKDEQQAIVDDTPVNPLETDFVQESVETTTLVVASEVPAAVELPIPEEPAQAPSEEHTSLDTGADVEKHHEEQNKTTDEAEGETDKMVESVAPEVLEESTLAHESNQIENSAEGEQVEIIQKQLEVEASVAELSTAPVPEQPQAQDLDSEVHLTPVEAVPVSHTEQVEASEGATTDTLPATEDDIAANDVSESSNAEKDLASEHDPEDEGQLHAEETKPVEQSTDDLLTPVSGADIERPKSPWTPSFQVTTVGRGVSSSDEDEEVPTLEPELSEDVPAVEASANDTAVTETILGVPRVVTPEENGEVPEDSAPSDAELSQLHVDTASLDTPPAEIARPWTPSYSVHSQGSPLHGASELEQDIPISTSTEDAHQQAEDGPELPDMEFATNEETPQVPISVTTTEHHEPVPVLTEIPEEQSSLSDVPAPTADASLADEVPTASEVLLEVSEDTNVHLSSLRVNTFIEDDTQVPEPTLDTIEDVVARGEDEVEYSVPSDVVAQVPQLVLDTSEEVTEVHIPTEETSSSHLTPQYEQAPERPASPSWVASYSVSTQGSPLQEDAPLVEAFAPASEETTSSKDEPSPAPAVAEVQPEVTIQHSIPSESVEVPAVGETPIVDLEDKTDTEEVADTKPPSFVVLVNDTEADIQEETPPATSLTLVDDATNQQDQPKIPWTPSYSVTMQGPGTPGEEEELNNIEPLPQRAVDVNVPGSDDHDDLRTKSIVPEVEEKVLTTNLPVVNVIEESKLPPVQALERELQELQAAIQSGGGDVTPVANVAIVDAAQQEYFPSVETTEQKGKLSKLSVSRLAPVDETEGLDTGITTSETVSSPSTRSRLESTTSSRFFPGGWFSTASKVVDEGRTSLEIAQGEFTPSKIITSAPSAGDVSDTPDDASATSVATGHATDSDDEDDEPEPKRRWCVVM